MSSDFVDLPKNEEDKESLYQILRIDRKATQSEIAAAYHSAKTAFSKDSVATYSLFSAEETKEILQKFDEAFRTLSNPDARRNYDRSLDRETTGEKAPVLSPPKITAPQKEVNISLQPTDVLTGARLKNIREARGLSIEEVCRITKISMKTLKAIEEETIENLPVRVYLQGFLKNLGKLYRIDPNLTSELYLRHLAKDREVVMK